ncbi:MAG TPA: decaprenyl-phosphate phosphoribosyltransferase [Candidatus Margulisiibacteriota bacterium]|nr:decaprenyl-phosphate phosphoribosyltransferase [Candidatus Margulisiibacteriota bacterium]
MNRADAVAAGAAHVRTSALRDLWQLLRPTQWAKNLVVFAALIFAKHLFNRHDLILVTLGFVSFCLTASAAYIMNDLRDCERDRQHPLKSLRPLPAGRVRRGTARVLAVALLASGLGAALALQLRFGALVVLYFLLQIAYTFWLKEAVILDVMAIAAGFVIRAAAGGVIIAVPVSPWLIICTFLLALFLGFSKRRHELILLEGRATEHRASLKEYSPYFLDQMIAVVTASTVVAYAIWTVSPEIREKLGTEKLYLTIPFVLFGIFRYLYLVHQREEGGNPTQLLLSDRPLLVDVLLWIITAAVLLYWKP